MTRRTVTASVVLDANDSVVDVDATAGAVTVRLPASGQAVTVRKIDHSANAVTIEANTGQANTGPSTLNAAGDMAAYTYDSPTSRWSAVLSGTIVPLPAIPASPRTITFTGTYNGNAVDLTATFD